MVTRWSIGILLASFTVVAPVAADPLPTNTHVDYQLGGAYPLAEGVGIVVRDRQDSPAAGHYSICYVNAFQTQPSARRWWLTKHPSLVLRSRGRPVVDSEWGEMLLDTGRAWKRRELARIMGRWIDGCRASGFDAVEPDNLDSWQRSQGLLDRKDNVRFSRLLIDGAHEAGLAIAQKNAAGLAAKHLFDFAVVEQCQRYRECARFTRVYGDQVLEIEYRRRDFRQACRIRGAQIPVVWRDVQLVRAGRPGYRFATC
jgi:hypothetical protein